MLLFIENIEHSHDSANFVAGASSICSKAEVEFVAISLHSVLYAMGRQQLTKTAFMSRLTPSPFLACGGTKY